MAKYLRDAGAGVLIAVIALSIALFGIGLGIAGSDPGASTILVQGNSVSVSHSASSIFSSVLADTCFALGLLVLLAGIGLGFVLFTDSRRTSQKKYRLIVFISEANAIKNDFCQAGDDAVAKAVGGGVGVNMPDGWSEMAARRTKAWIGTTRAWFSENLPEHESHFMHEDQQKMSFGYSGLPRVGGSDLVCQIECRLSNLKEILQELRTL